MLVVSVGTLQWSWVEFELLATGVTKAAQRHKGERMLWKQMEPYKAEIPPASTVPNAVCVTLLKKPGKYLPSRNCAFGNSICLSVQVFCFLHGADGDAFHGITVMRKPTKNFGRNIGICHLEVTMDLVLLQYCDIRLFT